MEPETELDAVLIDEFDAETAPPCALRVDDALARRKSPVLGAAGFRGLINNVEAPPQNAPLAANDSTASASSSLPALRHYPSLDAIPMPVRAPSRYQTPNMTARPTGYPRFESGNGSSLPEPMIGPKQPAQGDSSLQAPVKEPVSGPPRTQSTRERVVEQVQQTHAVSLNEVQDHQEDEVTVTPQLDAVPTDEEMDHERRQIEAELQRFQQQVDYVARALAGDTPHQKEMRRLREIERQEREDRRLAAVDTRIEHMVEREQQREARQEQRRQRHAERAHRSSVSPSPERDDDDGGDDLEDNATEGDGSREDAIES